MKSNKHLLTFAFAMVYSVHFIYAQLFVNTCGPGSFTGMNGVGFNSPYVKVRSLAKENHGDVLFAATAVDLAGKCTIRTSKLTTNGVPWKQFWDSPVQNGAYANDLTTDEDGNLYVTGYFMNTNNNLDLVILKYDNNGILLWVKQPDFPSISGNEQGNAITYYSGKIFVAGVIEQVNGHRYGVTICYLTDGTPQWTQFDGLNNKSENLSICTDHYGDVYVAGISEINGYNLSYINKWSNDGTHAWGPFSQSSLPNPPIEIIPARIVADVNGVILGSSGLYTNTNKDFSVIKYDFSGSVSWNVTYDGYMGDDHLEDIFIDKSNRTLYATGGTYNPSSKLDEIVMISLNSTDGKIHWTDVNSSGTLNMFGKEISLDCNDQPYVGGAYSDASGFYTYLIVGYSTALGKATYFQDWNNSNFSSLLNNFIVVKDGIYASGLSLSPDEYYVPVFQGSWNCNQARLSGGLEFFFNNVFPNPTHGKCSFESDWEGSMTLYDINSQKHREIFILKGSNELDLFGVPNGIYQLVGHDESASKIFTTKLIISK